MKIIFLFLMSYITLSNVYAVSKGGINEMPDVLELNINIDKEVYKIGDDIVINYQIKNISNKEVHILPWYNHNWIDIYDLSEKKVEKRRLIVYELKMIPEEEDFVSLSPKESFNTTLKGTVKKDGEVAVDKNGRYQKIQGLFIDFKDSAFIVGNAGEYIIKAIYEGENVWKEEGENKYNFTNIWTGKIESNEIKIRIVE